MLCDGGVFEGVFGEVGEGLGAVAESRFIARKTRDGAEYLATLGMTDWVVARVEVTAGCCRVFSWGWCRACFRESGER